MHNHNYTSKEDLIHEAMGAGVETRALANIVADVGADLVAAVRGLARSRRRGTGVLRDVVQEIAWTRKDVHMYRMEERERHEAVRELMDQFVARAVRQGIIPGPETEEGPGAGSESMTAPVGGSYGGPVTGTVEDAEEERGDPDTLREAIEEDPHGMLAHGSSAAMVRELWDNLTRIYASEGEEFDNQKDVAAALAVRDRFQESTPEGPFLTRADARRVLANFHPGMSLKARGDYAERIMAMVELIEGREDES